MTEKVLIKGKEFYKLDTEENRMVDIFKMDTVYPFGREIRTKNPTCGNKIISIYTLGYQVLIYNFGKEMFKWYHKDDIRPLIERNVSLDELTNYIEYADNDDEEITDSLIENKYSIEEDYLHSQIMEFYYPYVNVYGEDNTTEKEIILEDLRYMSLDEFRTSKDEFTNYDYACVAIKIILEIVGFFKLSFIKNN